MRRRRGREQGRRAGKREEEEEDEEEMLCYRRITNNVRELKKLTVVKCESKNNGNSYILKTVQ